MKIGIDVRKINDYGIGTHIRNVVLAAAGRAKNHEFHLFYDPSNIPATDPSFHLAPEPAAKYSLREHFSLARKAQELGIELFHSPHYTLPLRLEGRSIVTVHDLIHIKFQKYFPKWKVQAAKYVLRRAVQKSEKIIVVSETTKRDLVEWMPESESKLHVVYNRLSEEWFHPAQETDLAGLGIPDEFLLYTGNFKKHKAIDVLIDAYRRGKDLPFLVLIGQNRDLDHDLSQAILNTPNVRLLGFARAEFLHALYAKAILFVFPSRYEGFGYPPLEAMACGCPVLSSDAPAMKEVLGNAAEYFASGNSEDLLCRLVELCSNQEKRRTLSKMGREQAAKFISDASLNQLLEIWS